MGQIFGIAPTSVVLCCLLRGVDGLHRGFLYFPRHEGEHDEDQRDYQVGNAVVVQRQVLPGGLLNEGHDNQTPAKDTDETRGTLPDGLEVRGGDRQTTAAHRPYDGNTAINVSVSRRKSNFNVEDNNNNNNGHPNARKYFLKPWKQVATWDHGDTTPSTYNSRPILYRPLVPLVSRSRNAYNLLSSTFSSL